MAELIVISAGIAALGIGLLGRKVPRAMIREIIKDGFHTTEIEVTINGKGEKELHINGKNGTRTVVVP